MAQSVEIKTSDPRMALGLSEGANAVALREVEAENRQLKAREGVRREADSKRWKTIDRRLARKYTVKPVGRVRGAILGAWALLWLDILGWYEYFKRLNRGA